jgi:hypothetical protein
MSKEITICFRTSDWLRNAFEAIAREERRSLSQVIELVLQDYVKDHHELPSREEGRHFARKQTAIPAFVKGADSPANAVHGAVILRSHTDGL